MVKFFAYIILVLALYAINAGFVSVFPLWGSLPDLFLLLCIFWALEEKNANFAFGAFVLGLLWDVAGGVFFGTFSLGFLMVFVILRAFNQEVAALEFNRKFFPFILFAAQLVIFLWAFLYSRLLGYLGTWPESWSAALLARRFLGEYIYNLILLYPLWKLAEIPKILQQKFSPRIR